MLENFNSFFLSYVTFQVEQLSLYRQYTRGKVSFQAFINLRAECSNLMIIFFQKHIIGG